jgi:hypothetical protein
MDSELSGIHNRINQFGSSKGGPRASSRTKIKKENIQARAGILVAADVA